MNELPDQDLLALWHDGNQEALGILWTRHCPTATAFARSRVPLDDADDLVANAFEQILRAHTRGHGPQTAFRAYLLTAVRHEVADYHQQRLIISDTDLEEIIDPHPTPLDVVTTTEALGYTRALFLTLPATWQTALWYANVEHLPLADIATRLGINPAAAASLLYRARKGFRNAWLKQTD